MEFPTTRTNLPREIVHIVTNRKTKTDDGEGSYASFFASTSPGQIFSLGRQENRACGCIHCFRAYAHSKADVDGFFVQAQPPSSPAFFLPCQSVFQAVRAYSRKKTSHNRIAVVCFAIVCSKVYLPMYTKKFFSFITNRTIISGGYEKKNLQKHTE